MELSQAVEWSREENVDVSHDILLSKVPLNVGNDIVSRVLDTVKVLGRTRIHGCLGDKTGRHMFILVETVAALEPVSLPPEVGIVGEAGPWSVHALSSLPSANLPEGDAFEAKLLALLQQEGKSMGDVNAVVMGTQPLRLFSGLRPVPPGEEEYDSWMEQATQMITEWQCADAAKRQRIVESLRGPAADIVRFLKVSNPSSPATEYLAALDTVYGSTESGADLMASFRHTFQEDGERLSAYLYRLDKLLHRVLVRGGIGPADLNHACMEQLFKGALTTDLVALRVRMMHTLQDPPTFSQLMREIQEEEHWPGQVLQLSGVPKLPGTFIEVVPQVPSTNRSEDVGVLSPSSFDFGTSSMPEEAKRRLCEKMMQRNDVFLS
ncbi:paraneoplastic antigen Ma1 homolog [Lampris incognitus]|uniref:paraneoplastic antigen Ma1 homolog n=1 Tax=Lampris incognitus TaxID=2546036 RepID=UPI0024B55ECB|nr:paraneoplastic antigen Ma1 homolog [Lampris incognitus]